MATKETKAVLRGEYGQTVKPMSQEVIDKVIPGEERITCRYADLLDNEMDKLEGEMKEWKQQDEGRSELRSVPSGCYRLLQVSSGTAGKG